ncbi:MAG: sensor histidine kinase [Dehalococcoidia bacterium]|nr:MAG: sensor histidine kinase [Dehalococcoidia bacterium]
MQIKWSLKSLILKFNAVSIRTKIVGLVTLCILFSSSTLVWYTDRDASMALRHESQEMGTTVASVLAGQSLGLVRSGDLAMLSDIVKGYVDSSKDIYYIYILDSTGITIASASKPPDLADLPLNNPSDSTTTPRIQSMQYKGQEITDIALSLPAPGKGTVHVGLTYANISQTLATHIQHILLWLILVFSLGIALAYFLSYALTYPISAMAAQARELGMGAYKQRDRQWGHDEIGNLGLAFDEMIREISQKEQMRSQLLAQVLSAQEDERKRIARELHDDTSQSLTSLMVELKAAENAGSLAEIKPRLTQLRSLVHQTLQAVHNMAIELRPNALDDLGLVAALRKYVADFIAKNGIHVDLQVGEAARRRFPADMETAAYRITQEALANIARHANARNISIVVDFQDSVFTLIVEDDGVGFDLNEASRSSPEHRLGLFGMYERASLVGGRLVIESQPQQGTSIFLEVPIKPTNGGING